MDGLTFAQATAQMLGLKLGEAAKLADDDCKLMLLTVAHDIREALIVVGLRKRKSRKMKLKTKKGVK